MSNYITRKIDSNKCSAFDIDDIIDSIKIIVNEDEECFYRKTESLITEIINNLLLDNLGVCLSDDIKFKLSTGYWKQCEEWCVFKSIDYPYKGFCYIKVMDKKGYYQHIDISEFLYAIFNYGVKVSKQKKELTVNM